MLTVSNSRQLSKLGSRAPKTDDSRHTDSRRSENEGVPLDVQATEGFHDAMRLTFRIASI